MGTVIGLKVLVKEEAGYAEGLVAGKLARERGLELGPYYEVGIDDYARGFRAGFFSELGLTGTWGN